MSKMKAKDQTTEGNERYLRERPKNRLKQRKMFLDGWMVTQNHFGAAVDDGTIPGRPLVAWKGWHKWRSADGGLRSGDRGQDMQRTEARLWRAATVRYYGADYK